MDATKIIKGGVREKKKKKSQERSQERPQERSPRSNWNNEYGFSPKSHNVFLGKQSSRTVRENKLTGSIEYRVRPAASTRKETRE